MNGKKLKVLFFLLVLFCYSFVKGQQVVQDWELIENGGFEFTGISGSSNSFVDEANPWIFMPAIQNQRPFGSFIFYPNSYFDHSYDCADNSEILFKYNVKAYAHEATIQIVDILGNIVDVSKYITSFEPGINEFGFQSPHTGVAYSGMIFSFNGTSQYLIYQNCGILTVYGGIGTSGSEIKGRIAIQLDEPLNPCKQYDFSAWVSKMDNLSEDDDPKIKVYVAHNIDSDLSPAGGSQTLDSWEITNTTSWIPISKTFSPDDNYVWLIFEMNNSAFLDHKTAGLYIDDVSLADVCKQWYYCDDKTVGNLDMVHVSHTVIQNGSVPEYATVSNLEYATSMDIEVFTTAGSMVYKETGIQEPAFNYKWAPPGNWSFAQYLMRITVYNHCCSRSFTVPIQINGNPGPYPYPQKHFARAPLQCCRPYIILDNTILSGNQIFQATNGIILQNNVICDENAEISLIAADYVDVHPNVTLTPNSTIAIEPCPRACNYPFNSNESLTLNSIENTFQELNPKFNIVVFPNIVPSGDKISIRLLSENQNNSMNHTFQLKFYSTSGQLIFQTAYNAPFTSSIEIETGIWSSGLYIVHLATEDGLALATEKFMVYSQ
jgi:hypothetical protein